MIRYIKEEGLPAVQRGRPYFIRLEDLFEWRMGWETIRAGAE